MMVIPAWTGMYCKNHWIPVFACLRQAGRNDGKAGSQESVIPAKAGIQEGDAGMLDSSRLSLV